MVTAAKAGMDKERIIAAGESALALAQDLAAAMLQSSVPPAHWDEVLHRVAQIVAEHVPELDDAETQPKD